MLWLRVAALAALVGCGTSGPTCQLIGCESLLKITLPAGVASVQACADGVCSETVVGGVLQLPLSRKAEDSAVQVEVTTRSATGQTTAYAGEVTPVRTRAAGPDCPVLCVNATASLDPATRTVVPG
ncbi:MAG: hypothetical protein Q8R60_18605 [Mycobacteriales bacterium]|nr:hypothetical protein [Mycobacteriales bacterium]